MSSVLFFSVFFEIVATYFYPKPYMTYGELGRIRGEISEKNQSTIPTITASVGAEVFLSASLAEEPVVISTVSPIPAPTESIAIRYSSVSSPFFIICTSMNLLPTRESCFLVETMCPLIIPLNIIFTPFFMGLFYDFNLCAVADACRICVVGINVHLESEVLVYSDLNVKPSGASLAVYVYGNGVAILKTELCRIVK